MIIWYEYVLLLVGLYQPTGCFEIYDILPAASSYMINWFECMLLPVELYQPTGCFKLCDILPAASSYVIPSTGFFKLYDKLV